MPTTIGQHTVATFTSPVNGTTPIDANTVRGNDNTIRTSYNNHDSDPGIHVQSSTLASRPVAGTAGRKWITEDSGVYTLWIDDGANWHPVSGEAVALSVYATQTLARGDVVKVTGWNNGQDLPEVAKVSSATDVAFAVMTAATASGAMGYATNTGILQDVATNAFSVGDILYPNTSGSFTATKPTSGNYQPCGFVLRSNVNNGVLYVEFSAPRIVERSDNTASTVVLRDASGNFSAGTITATLSGSITGNAATATALQTARNINGVSFNGTADITVTAAAGTLTGTTLASNVVSSSLTSVGTLANLTVTNTITGSVSGSSGSTTGNAATATALQTARTINGVSFNGTADITVTAAAGTLSGNTLASGVTASSLTSVGTLSSLTVSGNATFDTNTLFVDAANNRVGVGTASPGVAFDVQGADGIRARVGATSAGTSGLILSSGGATAYTIKAGNADSSLRIDQDGNDRITLASGGNLGLGTASLKAYSGFTSLTIGNNGNGGVLAFRSAYNSGDGAEIYQNSAGTLLFNINSTLTAARLDASGNFGLGVTPSAWAASSRAIDIGSFTCVGQNTAGAAILAFNAFQDSAGTWTYKTNNPAARHETGVNGTAAHAWYTAASGTAGNAISFTQAMTLNASGGLQTLNTIGVGNTTPATSGAGISFPATQSASSDANTLDDYEEGTWVPTLTNLTLGNAVTAFRYVKVGQMVTLDIVIEWGSTTSASGQWRISLPFNAQATGGGSAYLYDDTGSEYVVPATVYTASFGQTLVIGSGSGAGFVTNTAPFTWAQNDRFGCSITYRATA